MRHIWPCMAHAYISDPLHILECSICTYSVLSLRAAQHMKKFIDIFVYVKRTYIISQMVVITHSCSCWPWTKFSLKYHSIMIMVVILLKPKLHTSESTKPRMIWHNGRSRLLLATEQMNQRMNWLNCHWVTMSIFLSKLRFAFKHKKQ